MPVPNETNIFTGNLSNRYNSLEEIEAMVGRYGLDIFFLKDFKTNSFW